METRGKAMIRILTTSVRLGRLSLAAMLSLTAAILLSVKQEYRAQNGVSGQVGTGNQIGRLTTSGNGRRRTVYQYDELGRIKQTSENFEGQAKSFSSSYGYAQSQIAVKGLGTVIKSQTFPDNERVDYGYDASGGQVSIVSTPVGLSGQTIISRILRNA